MRNKGNGKVCPNCHTKNEENVRYCQGCGTYLKSKFSWKAIFGDSQTITKIAGMGAKGVSLAPLGTIAAENQGKEAFGQADAKVVRTNAKVIPLADGSWFCPDCGYYNNSQSQFCVNCEKYR